MAAESRNIEMVDCHEVLHENEVMNFIVRLPANENLTVVSIIGRQSTGKSSLLNSLFGTNFDVLDDQDNHGRTTSGIWIAQCPTNPSIVVIDIEGSDSSANAQNGASFANRAALFALTISDVLLLNMCVIDMQTSLINLQRFKEPVARVSEALIRREVRGLGQNEGGSLPLLQTIFRERISLPRCKTGIEVILRDCRNLTNANDIHRAHEIIQQCWASGPATNGRLQDYIEVSVETFPNATDTGESIQEAFRSKVAQLWDKLTRVTPTQSRDTFRNNVLTIWPVIRSNRNLDIPSYNETLSINRCKTIMQQELSSLYSNEAFIQLRDMEDTTSLWSFQRILAVFLTSTLERFDISADGSLPEVRDGFKARLQQEIINKLEDKFSNILRNETSKIVEQKKGIISSHLTAMKKGILSRIFTLTFNLEALESNIDVESIVNDHVREFDQLFEDCRKEYRKFVPFSRELLGKLLKDYAEREINEINKRSHKKFVAIGKGIIIVVGVAISGCLLNWYASMLLAQFRPALATGIQVASSKIPTLFECILQDIITPAVKICVKQMMKNREIIVSQLGNQMFNLSMAMFAILIQRLTKQQHSQPYSETTYSGAPTKRKLPML